MAVCVKCEFRRNKWAIASSTTRRDAERGTGHELVLVVAHTAILPTGHTSPALSPMPSVRRALCLTRVRLTTKRAKRLSSYSIRPSPTLPSHGLRFLLSPFISTFADLSPASYLSTRTDLLDATRQLVHTSTPLLKTLLSHPIPASNPQRKSVQQKLSREYQSSLAAFQKIQRIAAEKQRTYVEVKKREVRHDAGEQSDSQLVELEEQGLLQSQQQEQAQAQVS